MDQDRKFKAVIPAHLEKSEDGKWRVFGLASTTNMDQQGEKMNLAGLDLSPIEKGRGFFNWDHKKGPENTVGVIDTYKKSDSELYLGGYLFKEHEKAKAVHQIMNSLDKSDRGRMGLSVEGVIKQRAGSDGKTINKAIITNCAITMNPVNSDTYVNLIKSMSGLEVEFDKDCLEADFVPDRGPEEKSPVVFTAEQVAELMAKALAVGPEKATTTPSERTGGAALAREDLDSDLKEIEPLCKKCGKEHLGKCSKYLKKGDSEFFKSGITSALTQLQELYPEMSRAILWELFKDRLHRKFPDMRVG